MILNHPVPKFNIGKTTKIKINDNISLTSALLYFNKLTFIFIKSQYENLFTNLVFHPF